MPLSASAERIAVFAADVGSRKKLERHWQGHVQAAGDPVFAAILRLGGQNSGDSDEVALRKSPEDKLLTQ